jgi:CTP synthase (UTP-ammonia lyase)
MAVSPDQYGGGFDRLRWDNVAMLHIGVVGDYDAQNETHVATTSALREAAGMVGVAVDVAWVETSAIESIEDPVLQEFDGLLIAPGSPYRSMEGALFAIARARARDIPLLGTCGGFQHIVVEFSRNALGFSDAEHAETSPDAPTLVITPLSCSLFGQRMDVDIVPETSAAAAYGRLRATERFYCNFGLNPDFRDALVAGGLVVSGTDADGAVRIIEHPDLRFFMGTLFVPQATSTPDHAHPLLLALIIACTAVGTGDTRLKASNAAIGRLTSR